MSGSGPPPRQKSFFRSLKALGLSDVEYKQLYDEFQKYKAPVLHDVRHVFEISWEAANKVGGIYQVIRSKAGVTTEELGDKYLLIGPYNEACVSVEVEINDNLPDPYRVPIEKMRERGVDVVTGKWLIEGYPNIILFKVGKNSHHLSQWRDELWNSCKIAVPWQDVEVNDTIIFGGLVAWFLGEFAAHNPNAIMVAQFHEWLTGVGLLLSRVRRIPICSIFTTHATLLGRFLCAGSVDFYNSLSKFNLDQEAGSRGIYHRYCIERGAAHVAHVFTTLSQITAYETEHLLCRKPDVITPNGLALEKFKAPHEFQNLHAKYKDRINDFVRGHFYGHYDFDFDRTIYLFIAGRYEFSNKGADMFIESLARLNYRLQLTNSDKTVVAFLIFPATTNNFNVETLKGQAVARQTREAVSQVQANVGKRLFEKCLRGELPNSNDLLAQEDIVKLKRCILAAQRSTLPPICTHNIVSDSTDPVLSALRRCNLINKREDKVKVIFHPEFITQGNPLFGIDYQEFVRGCHLGVFPSYYEPWGYTPAECTVMGIPSITTNLSGFGCYMQDAVHSSKDYGIYIIDRRFKSPDESIQQLSDFMYDFVNQSQRERINQRNRTERLSELLSWRLLGLHYQKARMMAIERVYPELANANEVITDWGFVRSAPFPRPKSVASMDNAGAGVDKEEESADGTVVPAMASGAGSTSGVMSTSPGPGTRPADDADGGESYDPDEESDADLPNHEDSPLAPPPQ